MKTIIVASKNPVKINAAKAAFTAMMPEEEFVVEGISVPSGVRDQPMDSPETRQGAQNRARGARDARPEADYTVGFEGGLETIADTMYAFGWVAIIDKAGKESTTPSAMFAIPKIIRDQIDNGAELGPAMNELFSRSDIKHTSGSVGVFTQDLITRTDLYVQPAILALIPYTNTDLFQ